MATIRATELLNNLLKIFNISGDEYKKLIGDPNRVTYLDFSDLSLSLFPDYVGGTDVNLTTPDDAFDQDDCFIPMAESTGTSCKILLGNWEWIETTGAVGGSQTIVGQTAGAAFGVVKLNSSTNDWDTFADVLDNGLQRIYFPQLVNNDKVGGYIEYQWNYNAFYNAFNGNAEDCVFTTDGSVWKTDNSDINNLVITLSGIIGPAGGNYTVKINDINTGSISNSLEYMRRISTYLIKQMNLQLASDSWLDWIGDNVYGISRLGGESDADYADRIVNEIFAIKCTPVGLMTALLPYADAVEIEDGPEMGAFHDVSFFDCYTKYDFPPETIKRALMGTTGGLPYYFYVILTNPDLAYGQKITNIVDEYKAAGTDYEFVIVP